MKKKGGKVNCSIHVDDNPNSISLNPLVGTNCCSSPL